MIRMDNSSEALPVSDAMLPQESVNSSDEQTTENVSDSSQTSVSSESRTGQKLPIVQLPVVQVAPHQPLLQAPVVRPVVQPAGLQSFIQPNLTPQSQTQLQFLPISSSQPILSSPRQGNAPKIPSTGHILQVPSQSILPG